MASCPTATEETVSNKRLYLLESEQSFINFNVLPGIASVTFFDGNPPLDYLRNRTRDIVEANPWLYAKPSKEGGINHMVYPENTTDLPELFQSVDAGSDAAFQGIDRSKSYDEICEAAIPLMIKKGSEVTEDDKGSFLVSAVTHPRRNAFALVVSLSHVVGDGHTFYALHHMLSTNAAVETLDPERDSSFAEKQKECMGEAMARGVTDVPLVLRSLMGVLKLKLYTKSLVRQLYYVDDDYIENRKRAFAKQRAEENDDEIHKEPTFISTNDILASWFYSRCKTQFSLMAINLRNRVAGVTDRHAGNYENFLLFQHDDCREPALVRRAVASCGRDKAYPGAWRRMTAGPFGVFSNWATLDRGLELPHATERLHLPLYPKDYLQADLNLCIVFRPTRDRLAMFFMSDRGVPVGDAGANTSPLGEALDHGASNQKE